MIILISDNTHPKIIEFTFSFLGFPPICKKNSSFDLFIFEIQSILESCDQTGHTPFWPCSPKNFDHDQKSWSSFNVCKFASTCKKSGYFIDFFWRYGWLKNPAIWLVENILASISGTKNSPNMGFVQKHSK